MTSPAHTDPLADVVLWHDLECGAYTSDLALWRELAATAAGPVLEIGAGAGRVSLDLARAGHDVTALDNDPPLLAALRERADAAGLAVTVAESDARGFALPRRFTLCVVPMQTVQLLGGPNGREAMLAAVHAHLEAEGILAMALAEPFEGIEPGAPFLPLPDMLEQDGWVYASQPISVTDEAGTTAIERVRQVVAPDGTRTETADVVRLDHVSAAELESEAAGHGFAVLETRRVEPTDEHVGSEVVVLRA